MKTTLDSLGLWLRENARSLIAAMIMGVAPVWADTPSPPGLQLQEVVVTAERHVSTVQKTPISITALSGDQLAQRGLSTLNQVASAVPGISVRTAGPGQTQYQMRGLSSSGGSTATVGLYLNNIPLSAPAVTGNGNVTIDPDLFDLNRVEVLRGPQGTLYGAGSEGGTIRLMTNDPDLNGFESQAEAILSDTKHGGFNWGGNAMLNLPIVQDRLAVRLVGTDKFNDGWIDRNVVSPFPLGPGGNCGTFASCTRGDVQAGPFAQTFRRSNWERLTGGRGEIRFKPSDPLTIDLLGMYQKISMGGFSEADIPPGTEALAHYSPFDIAEPYSDTFRLYSLDVKYDLGFAALTSTTAHWSRDSAWVGDVSEQFQSLLAYAFGLPQMLPVTYGNNDYSKQTSEEVHLASEGDAPWQWVIGGFYENFESIFNQLTGNPAYAAISYGGSAANPDGLAYQADNPYHINQSAAYAQSSYRFADGLKPTIGLRWYKYDTNESFEQAGLYSQTGNASQYTGAVSGNDSGISPMVNLAYLPNDQLTLYAQAAKGFRPGGVNLPVPVPPCAQQAPLSYKPDSLWDYEIGEKSRLFGGRLVLNSDYYYIIWSGVQEYLTPACGFPDTQNAGTAISSGPELELAAQLTSHWTFDLNGTYTHAYIRDVSAAAAGQVVAPTTALTPGMPLENVPRYTVSAALDYHHPISESYAVTARLDATRTGPSYDLSYYFQELPAYTIVDLRVGLVGDRLSAYLFADNLANKIGIQTINTMTWSLPVPSFERAAVTTPRTIGVDLSYRF